MLAEVIGEIGQGRIQPRYNIAPTQQVAVVRQDAGGAKNLAYLRWGLIPHWAKDVAVYSPMIKARAETFHEKPAVRHAFRSRRCLITANERWQEAAALRSDERRRPHDLRRPLGELEIPGRGDRRNLHHPHHKREQFIRPIHDRMPVILGRHDWDTWLSRDAAQE